MEPFTPQDVQAALDAFDLGLRIQFFEESTATSQEAADATGVELGQIAKSICFLVDKQPILVLASGDQRVDTRKLAALRGVGHKKVKIARPEQCIEVFGYVPGGVPPVGHRTPPAQTYIEDSLARYTNIYAAAGAPNAVFPLTLDQLRLITHGELADLKMES